MTAVASITVRSLREHYDVLAPDGSEVRILATSDRGSMAHFKLHPGQVSVAVAHRTVEEIWYIVAGKGLMWCGGEGLDHITPLKAGVSISIPVGVRFQFRCDGEAPLEAIGVTMPPWPGMDEAYAVEGKW
jgi:mannose-6-phosphate isomerase-like protein (cupin superfamily)